MRKLSESQTKTLAAMGIQVWYKRGVGVDSAKEALVDGPMQAKQIADQPVPVESSSAQQELPQAMPLDETESAAEFDLEAVVPTKISFRWLKNGAAMVWTLEEDFGGEAEPFCHDILHFVKARVDAGESKVSKGNFLWPQVGGTSGTPTRPLKVFVEKHAADARYLIVTKKVAESVQEYLDIGDNLQLVVVDPIRTYLAETENKKNLWQVLAK